MSNGESMFLSFYPYLIQRLLISLIIDKKFRLKYVYSFLQYTSLYASTECQLKFVSIVLFTYYHNNVTLKVGCDVFPSAFYIIIRIVLNIFDVFTPNVRKINTTYLRRISTEYACLLTEFKSTRIRLCGNYRNLTSFRHFSICFYGQI